MKKILTICLAGLLAAWPIFAGQKKEVRLRSSQHNNSIRVVLESDDNSIRNSNIVASISAIKVEFPDPVEVQKPGDFIFETSVADRSVLIKLKNIDDISTYKLVAPSRIVIDLKAAQKLPVGPQPQAADKIKQAPQASPVKPVDSKTAQRIAAGAQPQPADQPKQAQQASPVKPVDSKTAQRIAAGSQPQPADQPKQAPQASPEKTVASKVICLDAGHGGYDYGLIAKDSKEKDLNLILAKDLGAALTKLGHKVFLTRKVDQSLALRERISLANRKTDIFISIHSSASNAFAVYTAVFDESGAESPVSQFGLATRQSRHIEQSRSLAKALGTSLKNEFKGNVYLRELPLPVISSMDSAAVLIEYPSVQLNAYDQKMRDRLIGALIKGIRAYE